MVYHLIRGGSDSQEGMMEVKSLNGAQVAAIGYLHTMAPIWINRHVRWVDIMTPDTFENQDELKAYIRVKVQIGMSRLRGMVVLVRDNTESPWKLSGFESLLGFGHSYSQKVRFGFATHSEQIQIQNA